MLPIPNRSNVRLPFSIAQLRIFYSSAPLLLIQPWLHKPVLINILYSLQSYLAPFKIFFFSSTSGSVVYCKIGSSVRIAISDSHASHKSLYYLSLPSPPSYHRLPATHTASHDPATYTYRSTIFICQHAFKLFPTYIRMIHPSLSLSPQPIRCNKHSFRCRGFIGTCGLLLRFLGLWSALGFSLYKPCSLFFLLHSLALIPSVRVPFCCS